MLNLHLCKKLSKNLLGIGKRKVYIHKNILDRSFIKSNSKIFIIGNSIRKLIKKKLILKRPINSVSKYRKRKRVTKVKNKNMRGFGKRKGTKNARKSQKYIWCAKIQVLRRFLKKLRYNKTNLSLKYKLIYFKVNQYIEDKREYIFIEKAYD
uniref:Ribosomal protein L19 n=1 Tax=Amorphochlora amoebiformis TaxID=1561963 RepID=A0A0H5BLS6_9EUKA|nr:ribosomal protein L19 [Amorphochlora amoebiformis]